MMVIMNDSTSDETNAEPNLPADSGLDATTVAGSSFQVSHIAPLPKMIGKYRIIRQIGEGGMGAVYEAEQESPKRRVALKVIKAGALSGKLLRRFEIEAQILGKLDHPGIATIFEAGTFNEGRGEQPFFAMEFVEGQLLTEYAESRKLGTRDRLSLLAKIAEAVQHAHQKGVIHRDLKPGNILVTDAGQIKVLDFGVARATDGDIQTATMQTDIGQLIGTIPYMSPEQASGNPDDLDTRSDVYALGVIAYELLTGQMPYDLKQKMIHEAVRVIQYDEPKTLSTINRTFRGDVEIIVGKALVKEKERCYQSASDLAHDIERYLNNEPIEARPPSTWYQLSKFSKRNKALVVGVAAVLIVSVVGALISVNFAMGEAEQKQLALDAAEEARIAKDTAELAQAEEANRANELQLVTDFQSEQLGKIEVETMGLQLRDSIIESVPEETRANLSDALKSVNFTNIALETLQANIFERTIEAIDTQFADQPLVQAQMLYTTANTLQLLGLLDLAIDPQSRALVIRRAQLGEEHQDTLKSINGMGALLNAQEKFAEAEPYFRKAFEGRRRVLGDEHSDTLNSINNLGALLMAQGKPDQAEPYYREALEVRRRVLGEDHPDTLNTISNLGLLLRAQGRLTEAEPYYFEALEGRRRVLGDDHPSTLLSMSNLGHLLDEVGRPTEAESNMQAALDGFRRVRGDDHPDTLRSLNNLGALLYKQGRLSEAERYYLEALEGRRRTLGNDNPSTLTSINNMGFLLSVQGKLTEAEPYFRETMEGFRRLLGDDHPSTLALTNNMGYLLQSQGKLAEAESYYQLALEGRRRVHGDHHPSTVDSLNNIGFLLQAQGRFDETEPYFREALNGSREAEPEGGARVASALIGLAMFLIEQDQSADAEPLLRESLGIRQRVMSEGDWLIWNTQSVLGESVAKQSKFVDAEALLVEAAEQINPPVGSQHRRSEAIQRVVDLYIAWHAAEPGNGYDIKAEHWGSWLAQSE